MENMFTAIAPATFLDDTIKTFDVFYKSGEEKMELYCVKGRTLPSDIRNRLHEENTIDSLYIHTKDKPLYESYLEEILGGILQKPELSTAEKSKLVYEIIERNAISLFGNPKPKKIQHFKELLFITVDFVLKDSSALHDLINLTSFDYSLHNHSINVGIYSMGIILEVLKVKPNLNCHETVAGYFLHDIGKYSTPIEILQKQGKLTPIEWKFIKRHPEAGCEVLQRYGALTKEAEIIVIQHHERYSGKGYPHGLAGKDIHFLAKICTIADVFDALTSHRPYRGEYTSFDALKIMKNELYQEFDPALFSLFVKLLRK